jgi:hypothetical protein
VQQYLLVNSNAATLCKMRLRVAALCNWVPEGRLQLHAMHRFGFAPQLRRSKFATQYAHLHQQNAPNSCVALIPAVLPRCAFRSGSPRFPSSCSTSQPDFQ